MLKSTISLDRLNNEPSLVTRLSIEEEPLTKDVLRFLGVREIDCVSSSQPLLVRSQRRINPNEPAAINVTNSSQCLLFPVDDDQTQDDDGNPSSLLHVLCSDSQLSSLPWWPQGVKSMYGCKLSSDITALCLDCMKWSDTREPTDNSLTLFPTVIWATTCCALCRLGPLPTSHPSTLCKSLQHTALHSVN